MLRKRLAKIVATVGPASAAPDNLKLLHEVGVDAFRLNFSHGSHENHKRAIKAIRQVERDCGDAIAIIADMQGPKLRVGSFENGSIELRYGEEITIELSDKLGRDGLIRLPHKEIFDCLEPGHVLKFDDGKLQITVRKNDGVQITGRVDVPGRLGDKKGINVIGAVLPMSAMTEKDKVDMTFALSQNVDFIALSFVQTVEDVRAARAVVGDKAGLIVKFEKPSAVEHIEEILNIADAAMVARGDLGVELPLEQVPVMQRRIIRTARALGKPVIVATHMLESMIDAPTPTRAEASDVATAIYQGTDAVMLSAETAVGRHPASAVAIMDRIIKAAEGDPSYSDFYFRSLVRPQVSVNDAISQSIRSIAEVLGCKLVLGFTKTGSTVKRIARQRPPCPILGLTPDPRVASRMALTWGVRPVVMNDPANFDDMLKATQTIAKSQGACTKGDKIIIAAGIPFGRPGTTDTLKIASID
ncbi:MAG TPA: pyruvate kinase [Hellea balneolensis]|uniref:Pyruvate kinase n=1 Tax=Hellea balneolensis TaxID=287478 RepID=A0A7C5LUB1_9PROT|nr:pyruvate kinase [Hellea balneolensis]